MSFFLFAELSLANAAPVSHDPLIVTDDGANIVNLGEEPVNRVTTVIFCIVYAFLLAFAQGYRAGRMVGRTAGTRVSDVLVFFQGFACTAFLFAVGIDTSGLGLSSDEQCYAAIRVCIVFYGAAKIALTWFLLERIHVVRAPFVDRLRDPFWLIGAFVTICAYGGIIGLEMINPESELSRVDGQCRIGIEPRAAIGMIVVDTVMNVSLTGVFIWQLRPVLAGNIATSRRTSSIFKLLVPSKEPASIDCEPSRSHTNLKYMLFRNLIGCFILLVNVVVNNTLFLTRSYARLSHACLLMCLTDVVVGMLITQWLSMRSAIENSASVHQPSGPDMSDSFSGRISARSRRQTLDNLQPQLDEAAMKVSKPASVGTLPCKWDEDAVHIDVR